ncbi:hypothetical protein A9Q76_02390 [Arcobacter sp. 31_11_sub10_T18]|nr:hypothetical protein A9Q76_02390 [Arcobacter sp. 31_11_sub10_T18]
MEHTETLTESVFIKVFFVLLALTILTFLQPYLMSAELAATVGIQMFISVIKTFIIGAYYMHLKYESAVFKFVVATAVITLTIFFIILSFDAIFRNDVNDFFS